MKENLRKEKGITLIALVVTIIVLIILAGVSINLVLGDNGIIAKARQARTETEQAKENEQIAMNELMEDWDDLVGGTTETGKDTETGVDFTAILADAKKNPGKYIHPEQDSDIKDIGIGTDGKPVNLGLWKYEVINNNEIGLNSTGDGSHGTASYMGNIDESGKIEGTLPAYIKIDGQDEFFSVTSMTGTFMNCYDLEICPEIPSTVKVIEYTFFGCNKLKSVSIPNGITSIEYRAFSGCYELTSITIPNSVTSIGGDAFASCSSLTSIIIPNSVTSIGRDAFYYCSSLTSITIPNSITSIGEYAFNYCTGLTSITIPNNVTSIGERAFASCSGLTNITIPNTVTDIGNYAFYECSGLTSISIGSGVTSIGSNAFDSCKGITNIVVDKSNSKYDSRDNCNAIIETTSNKLIKGCNNTIIPNNVTSIGYGAFSGCVELMNITIPNTVTDIGNYAFSNCSSLTSMTIGSNVTNIGEYAFQSCSKLAVVRFEMITAPTFGNRCFYKYSGDKITFYFKKSTVAEALKSGTHYNATYGTKSDNYSW